MHTPAADIDVPLAMRHAGSDLLSLALIDARNRSLRLLGSFEEAGRLVRIDRNAAPDDSPLWLIGHLGWYQEAWIARNVQRHRGRRCDARSVRLASIDPLADGWWDPRLRQDRAHHNRPLPSVAAVRQYLIDTLEVTLELLGDTAEHDDSMYFFRDALFHEDLRAEQLVELAQACGVALQEQTAPASWAQRMPLVMPSGHWPLGIAPEEGGYIFEAERGHRIDSFPDHDIDAQPVTWQQYLEFLDDGGYRNSRWWSPAGWEWVCREQRRAPLTVADPAASLVQPRFGRSLHINPQHPVVHISAFEAQAWCRWAGRRLPTEIEWVHAAQRMTGRGFRWGEVWEWMADRLSPIEPDLQGCNLPAAEAFLAACEQHRVLRGASTVTRGRLRDPRHRRHRAPTDAHGLTGFRSCAL